MVIVNIFAGLGNQMFQYAVARRLAHKLGVELKLDLSSFERCQHRKYQLHRFCVDENAASPSEIEALSGGEPKTLHARAWRKARRFVNRNARFRWGGFVGEPHFHFSETILRLPDDVYLFGLWQTEKYFDDASAIIRSDFSFKNPPTGLNADLAEQIDVGKNSVSLHVRRGDYVLDPHSAQSHGVCGLDYYDRAIRLIMEKVASPNFFVFSDDIEWTRSNLKVPGSATFVSHNGPDDGVEDMRLMSRCQHNIIANSTFSWWGAWLNPNPQKVVCAPRKWFGDNAKRKRSTEDLYPRAWVIL